LASQRVRGQKQARRSTLDSDPARFYRRLSQMPLTRALTKFAGLLRDQGLQDEAERWLAVRGMCLHLSGPAKPIFREPWIEPKWGPAVNPEFLPGGELFPARAAAERLYELIRAVRSATRRLPERWCPELRSLSEDIILAWILDSLHREWTGVWTAERWRAHLFPTRTERQLREIRETFTQRVKTFVILRRGWAVICGNPECLCLAATKRGNRCKGYVSGSPAKPEGLRASQGFLLGGIGGSTRRLPRSCCKVCKRRFKKQLQLARTAVWSAWPDERRPHSVRLREMHGTWGTMNHFRRWNKVILDHVLRRFPGHAEPGAAAHCDQEREGPERSATDYARP
jgi:hypothetical protein